MTQLSEQSSNTLRIIINGARNLMKKDIFGLSDPYVLVYQEVLEENEDVFNIQTTNLVGKTGTQKKTLNPSWTDTFETEVDRCKEVLIFDLFDENRITRDDFLGRVSIILSSMEDDKICEKVFKLEGKSCNSNISGDLIISLEFLSEGDKELNRHTGWFFDTMQKYKLKDQIEILMKKNIDQIDIEFDSQAVDDFCFDPENSKIKCSTFLTKIQFSKRLLKFLFETSDISEDDTDSMNLWLQKLLIENDELNESIFRKLEISEAVDPVNILIKCFNFDDKIPKFLPNIKTLLLPKFKSKSKLKSFLYDWTKYKDENEDFEEQHDNNGRLFYLHHKSKCVYYQKEEMGKEEELGYEDNAQNATKVVNIQTRRNISILEQENDDEENKEISAKIEMGSLPEGWEEKELEDGTTLYIDHINDKTTREDPRFLDPNIAGAKTRYSQDYKYKYKMFVRALTRLATSDELFDILDIRRDNVFIDSFRLIGTLEKHKVPRLREKLWVEFKGEQGNDFGGLSREWFDLLSKQMFNPYYGLFEYSAVDNYTLQINPDSVCDDNTDNLTYFRFIGRIVGMAVFHQRLINGFFIRPFYSMMLGKKVQLADMEYVDAEYHNSLVWIRDNDPECLELTFQVDQEVSGQYKCHELKPGGKNIKVTQENKLEYIDSIINWRYVGKVKQQMESFLRGFEEVVPLSYIKLFDEVELELLISGVGCIDVKDWKDNTEYSGYTASDAVIIWFWRLLLSWGDEMRSRLLQFSTGTSRVPYNGFAVSIY